MNAVQMFLYESRPIMPALVGRQKAEFDYPVFDAAWRAACEVRKCPITEVEGFIKAHYLHKRPAIVMLCLMMIHDGQPVGCVVFSAPPKEANKRYGGKTWELARLYLLDEIPHNAETWVISKSIKYIKQHHPDVEFLLSYADPSAGHIGCIYRAANWTRDGRTDDDRKTARNDYADARTGKKYGRRGNVPEDAIIILVPRVSKWRFVYAINQRKQRHAPVIVAVCPRTE